ncbi:hypothetical protein AB0L74_29445 [Streptomyces sp. NPDC052020]|uniref:hypothetical protein n=1 Tax=Streptomyces sp. NPDC052020 TaxID=3155677 RepID=UPI003416F4AD
MTSTRCTHLRTPPKEFTLKASSVVHDADLRDPAVAEQIRGESHGAKLQRFVPPDTIRNFHEEIRTGRRPGLKSNLATPAMLARTFITEANHYYHVSEFYPAFIGLPVATEALGIPPTSAYRMVRAGSFPCPTTYMGRKHVVQTKAIMHHMNIPDIIVHPDDVENGVAHAGGR